MLEGQNGALGSFKTFCLFLSTAFMRMLAKPTKICCMLIIFIHIPNHPSPPTSTYAPLPSPFLGRTNRKRFDLLRARLWRGIDYKLRSVYTKHILGGRRWITRGEQVWNNIQLDPYRSGRDWTGLSAPEIITLFAWFHDEQAPSFLILISFVSNNWPRVNFNFRNGGRLYKYL